MDKVIVELIDILRDLNKSLSMHIDNHNSPHVDDAIMQVGHAISDSLESLEKQVLAVRAAISESGDDDL